MAARRKLTWGGRASKWVRENERCISMCGLFAFSDTKIRRKSIKKIWRKVQSLGTRKNVQFHFITSLSTLISLNFVSTGSLNYTRKSFILFFSEGNMMKKKFVSLTFPSPQLEFNFFDAICSLFTDSSCSENCFLLKDLSIKLL
jgi:hypothetical protein